MYLAATHVYLAEIHVYLAEILVFFKNTPLNFLTAKNLPILFFGTNLYFSVMCFSETCQKTKTIYRLGDVEVVEAVLEVDFGIELVSGDLIQQVSAAWKWKVMLEQHFVDTCKIDTDAK